MRGIRSTSFPQEPRVGARVRALALVLFAVLGTAPAAWAADVVVVTAAQMLDVGATLVAVGTESFRDPTAGTRIAAGLVPRG